MKNKKFNIKNIFIGLGFCFLSVFSLKIYAYLSDADTQQGIIQNLDPTLDVVSKDISEVHPGISNTNDKVLIITKTINKNMINFEHGNPTFLLKIKSEPLSEPIKDMYISFEFTKEYVDLNSTENGDVSITKTLKDLNSGNYKIFEINTNRHSSSILNITNGVLSDNKKYANISLINGSLDNETSSIEFIETDYDFEMFSHNDILIEDF